MAPNLKDARWRRRGATQHLCGKHFQYQSKYDRHLVALSHRRFAESLEIPIPDEEPTEEPAHEEVEVPSVSFQLEEPNLDDPHTSIYSILEDQSYQVCTGEVGCKGWSLPDLSYKRP